MKKELSNFHPMPDKVMIEPESQPEKSEGGLYIPETAKERTQFGKVLEVGADLPPYLKGGEKVVFDKFAGTKICDGQGLVLFLKMEDIIAVVG